MSSTLSASHLDNITSTILDQTLHYRDVFMQRVLPRLTKQSKTTYIAAAISVLVVAKFYSIFAYPKKFRHLKHAPLLSYMASFLKKDTHVYRVNKFIIPGWEENNGLLVLYDPSGWTINVTNPDAVKTILYKTDIFPKSDTNNLMPVGTLIRKFFGETNLALANGHEWLKRRKASIANPVFHRSMPVKTFTHLSEKMIREIDNTKGEVPIQPLLQRFTLDAIGLVGFGFDFNAIDNPEGEWVTTYNEIAANIADFQFLFFPTFDTTWLNLFPARQKQHKNVEKMDKLFYSIIEHKRKAISQAKSNVQDSEKDLLTLMIEAGQSETDKAEPLSDSELRDELVLFFLAGHDTTSNTLTAALYYLAANPDIQHKARDEVLRILGDDHSDISPTLDQIKDFKYLGNVMKEAVRLATPATSIGDRKATRDTELAGTFIPEGSLVKVNILGLHYNPHLWNEPTKFNPDRFIEGGELESRSSVYSYLPFGGGSRQCIGMQFSLAEQRIALGLILRRYELSVPENSIHKDELKFSNNLFMNTASEVGLNFQRRY